MAYMIQCVIRPFKAVDCFIDFSQLKVILPLSQVYTNTIVLTVLRPFKVSSASLITVRFVISILSCRLTRFLYSTEYVTPPENCFCRPLLVNHGTFLPWCRSILQGVSSQRDLTVGCGYAHAKERIAAPLEQEHRFKRIDQRGESNTGLKHGCNFMCYGQELFGMCGFVWTHMVQYTQWP